MTRQDFVSSVKRKKEIQARQSLLFASRLYVATHNGNN